MVEAIAEQARELCYVAPGYATAARARLSDKLLEVLARRARRNFSSPPAALRPTKRPSKSRACITGKTKIISRYRSYHGSTMASIAATGDPRRWAMEPGGKGAGVVFAPETNCYDCPIKHTYPSCNIACADYIEHMIRNESDVAAIILEPVVGTNGVLVPPPEYFPRLREICDRHGVLMIADEVMAGWGRTGKWFAVDHWNVKPDILVTAKGITSAYVPLGLCATTQEDRRLLRGPLLLARPHLRGASAHARPRRRHHRRDAAPQARRARRRTRALCPRKARSPQGQASIVGDVRGLGLFFAVEIVKNRTTKQLFNTMRDKVEGKPLVVDQIAAKMMAQGVAQQAWVSHFVIAPPLIVTKEELDLGIAALDEHLVHRRRAGRSIAFTIPPLSTRVRISDSGTRSLQPSNQRCTRNLQVDSINAGAGSDVKHLAVRPSPGHVADPLRY